MLGAKKLRLERFGGLTRVRLTVRVLSARGNSMREGGTGDLLVVGQPRLREDGSSHDLLLLKLPGQCGEAAIRFSNDVPLRGRRAFPPLQAKRTIFSRSTVCACAAANSRGLLVGGEGVTLSGDCGV